MSTDAGYTVRRTRPNDDSAGNVGGATAGTNGGNGYGGQKSKQYGNEKTAWSQQHTYPLRASSAASAVAAGGGGLMADGSIDKIISNVQPPVRPTRLRVDESGIEFVESSASGGKGDSSNGTTATTTMTMTTTTTGAKTHPTAYNKNVNKRRKRVDNNMSSNINNNNNDNRHCTAPMWMAYGVDGIEHNVRRWIYNATSFANKTVSFR